MPANNSLRSRMPARSHAFLSLSSHLRVRFGPDPWSTATQRSFMCMKNSPEPIIILMTLNISKNRSWRCILVELSHTGAGRLQTHNYIFSYVSHIIIIRIQWLILTPSLSLARSLRAKLPLVFGDDTKPLSVITFTNTISLHLFTILFRKSH